MEKSKKDFEDSDYDDMIQSFDEKHDEGVILCGTRLEYFRCQEAYSDTGGGIYNVILSMVQYFMSLLTILIFLYQKSSLYS